ncbi:MAG: hydrogenase expression/formation protein HypE, partial [Zoogloeaceae bacterium]|nr:hydrogenase expression/formation protein HypE [Zoogloeaceae bacterium]
MPSPISAASLPPLVEMAHGAGGRAMGRMIEAVFARHFDNEWLRAGNDGAVLPGLLPNERLVMATDSHVVSPLFFPGGDIGCLAAQGTINDVAVMGARPLWLAAAFILEEGLPFAVLDRVVASMAAAARQAGVPVVTGDTKVVERGKGDGIYINSSGVGVIAPGVELSGRNCLPGDAVLLSGYLGDHGIAIVATREGLNLEVPVASDAAPLGALTRSVLAAAPQTRCFRDPTRGGLASTLNELARQSGTCMLVDEALVPVRDAVRGASDLLGYDVYHLANEGKMVAVVAAEQAEAALAAMRQSPYGADA